MKLLLALSFLLCSSFVAAKCKPGQRTRIVNENLVKVTFCPNNPSYSCFVLREDQGVRVIKTCNNHQSGIFGCDLLHGDPTILQLEGSISPREFRDRSGNLVGCGIEEIPTLNGTLRIKSLDPMNDIGTTKYLQCDF